jgi:hypothetical protein
MITGPKLDTIITRLSSLETKDLKEQLIKLDLTIKDRWELLAKDNYDVPSCHLCFNMSCGECILEIATRLGCLSSDPFTSQLSFYLQWRNYTPGSAPKIKSAKIMLAFLKRMKKAIEIILAERKSKDAN